MTTLIQGGWILGSNGKEHRLVKDGVVVFDKEKILYVGKSYTGRVDEVIDAHGKIVSPGFINMHSHVNSPINNTAFATDVDFRLTFGNPNIPYEPTKEKMEQNRLSEENLEIISKFTLCSLLKSGCTTVVEVGAGSENLVRQVGELGIRAYLGPGFRSAETYTGDDGTFYNKDWNEERGLSGLEKAKVFVEKYDGAYDRVKTLLIPMQVDNCTPYLLKEVRKAANEMKVRIATHAGQRVYEFQETIRRYNKTPIGLLKEVGLLGPDLTVGHSLMTTGHSWTAFSGCEDIEALAESGTSVAHCPLVSARTSCALQSFEKYLKMGVNMTLGTDTWPMDIISEMRWASLLCKIVESDTRAASSLDVYNAATLGGAKALGRDDLGRIVKGAKADIVILDVNNFRYAPIADPVKSLVQAGTCDDVEIVFVNGKKLVDGGKILGVDETDLIRNTQRVAEEEWKKVPKWDWAHRTIYDIGPMSLKPLEE